MKRSQELTFELHTSGFSPLAECVLIDSSHRVKNEMRKLVEGVSLFTNVTFAKSIDEAKLIVKTNKPDACYLGPSLSKEAYEELKKFLLQEEHCDVAILTFKSNTSLAGEETGKEIVIEYPNSKRVVFNASVHAILLAAKNSPWPGIKINEVGELMVLEDGKWNICNYKKDAASKKELPRITDPIELEEKIHNLIHTLDNGTLEESQTQIALLVLGTQGQNQEGLFSDFHKVVKKWKDEKSYLGAKEAALNFKLNLYSLTTHN